MSTQLLYFFYGQAFDAGGSVCFPMGIQRVLLTFPSVGIRTYRLVDDRVVSVLNQSRLYRFNLGQLAM